MKWKPNKKVVVSGALLIFAIAAAAGYAAGPEVQDAAVGFIGSFFEGGE